MSDKYHWNLPDFLRRVKGVNSVLFWCSQIVIGAHIVPVVKPVLCVRLFIHKKWIPLCNNEYF